MNYRNSVWTNEKKKKSRYQDKVYEFYVKGLPTEDIPYYEERYSLEMKERRV